MLATVLNAALEIKGDMEERMDEVNEEFQWDKVRYFTLTMLINDSLNGGWTQNK